MSGVEGLLGLCARAGRLITGEKAAVDCVRADKAFTVLLDGGAAVNTQKAVRDACAFRGVPLIEMPPDALGRAIGKPGRMAAAVTDRGFAARLVELSNQANA